MKFQLSFLTNLIKFCCEVFVVEKLVIIVIISNYKFSCSLTSTEVILKMNETRKEDSLNNAEVPTTSINEQIGTDLKFKRKIVWLNVYGFAIFHILGLVGLYGWLTGIPDIRTTLFGLLLGYASSFGITMGAHRLWCHRAYKAKRWLKFVLLVCQTFAGQVNYK